MKTYQDFYAEGKEILRELNMDCLNILSKLKVNVILLTVMRVGIELDWRRIKLSGIVKRVNKKSKTIKKLKIQIVKFKTKRKHENSLWMEERRL